MADYIYLLENRLSAAQQSALAAVRELARTKGLTVFLVGGAVRDLTSGSPVRDLDVAVQGNALKLRKDLEKSGVQISGEHEQTQTLYLRFPGNVRMELSSTIDVTYPKPGKPVVKAATIQEDLRRRDFTANSMALSLNEGSYGLLMDPLNGVADIENRQLRLVSNYGFIEDPVRMIRAVRLGARLGWLLEERTQTRYETGKAEGYISVMQEFQRGYELEEIVHEEDPLRVLGRLEAEGWMAVLYPAWTTAKVNVIELERLRDTQAQLQMQGVVADASAAQFPLLTAKMPPKDVAALKKLFPRRGFVAEIEALESEAKHFAAELSSKQAVMPSAAWRMIMSAPPEVVLWTAYSTRAAGLQAKFKSFYTEWPAARQRIPYALMQEMRILPELAGFDELVERLFFELMDARLGTPEEMKAFLEPHSPPAPPPPVNLRRARAAKSARTGKGKKRAEEVASDDGAIGEDLAAEAASDSQTGGQTAARTEKGAAAAAAPAKASRTATAAKAVAASANGGSRSKAAEPKAAPKKAVSAAGQKTASPTTKKATPAAVKAAPAKAKKVDAPKKAAKTPVPAKASKAAASPKKPAGAPAKKTAGKSASVSRKPVKPAKVSKPAAKPIAGKSKPASKPTKKAATRTVAKKPVKTASKQSKPTKQVKKAAPAKKSGRR